MLAEVGHDGRLARVGDCIVIAGLGGLECAPIGGGAVTSIVPAGERAYVEVVAHGADLITTSLPLSFGPDGDRGMRVERVSLDGARTTLATVTGGYGAGEGLGLAGDAVVFTTGGSADLFSVPVGGGQLTLRASDSGNFGDLAVIGTTVYYANGSIYRHELTGPTEAVSQLPAIVPYDGLLGADGATLVTVGGSDYGSQVDVVIIDGPEVASIPGEGGRFALAAGRLVVSAGLDLHEVDLATGETSRLVAGAEATDVLIDGDDVYWITWTGQLRRL